MISFVPVCGYKKTKSAMLKTAITSHLLLSFLLTLVVLAFASSGCVSARDALRMEAAVNCPLMKNLQDNDEDLFQIEDGIGAVGEAAACPT
ncbi:MAG: hypothetical protein FJ217_14710 [Ignavibacteria bacterium]|nr:hypothetical protein [Ignavibacteria bacterium]